MNVHKNAVLTPRAREQVMERLKSGESKASAAAAVGLSRQTARKWEKRMSEEGVVGLQDRSSRPHRSPTQVRRVRERQIARLRHRRWTQAAIADSLGMAISTFGAVCRRLGADLDLFLCFYNCHRPHLGIGRKTPQLRLTELVNNLSGCYS